MPKSERPKKRRVRLVGGGFRVTRESQQHDSGVGGSMKAERRLRRKLDKANKKRGTRPSRG